jgi:glucosamine kinase
LHGEAASIRIVEVRTVDVGIDIGGTKTHLRVHEVPGRPRDLIVPTANWRVRDLDKNAAALLGLARQIADGQEIGAVGAHGCDDASDCDAFQAAIARRAGFSVEVVNDAELLPAALGYENQIGLVVGTGSIAVCRDHKHGMMVAGGWGWIIGDEGSAPGLLREAARAASFHLERGGVLSEPLVMRKRSPSRTPRESVAPSRSLAGGRARPPCPPGVRGGEEGIATGARGARHLVGLVARLTKRGSQATKAVAGGGVIAAQRSLADTFLEEFAMRFEGEIKAEIYDGPPVGGACRLAAGVQARASRADAIRHQAPSA